MKPRVLVALLSASFVLQFAAAPVVMAAPKPAVTVISPAAAHRFGTFEVTLHAPADVAAIQGRVLFQDGAAELVGVAALRGGTAFRPVDVAHGAAFGAYGLTNDLGDAELTLVLSAQKAGKLKLRILVDAASDSAGQSVDLRVNQVRSIQVGGSKKAHDAPMASTRTFRGASGKATHQLRHDGRFDSTDLDIARAEWSVAAASDSGCSGSGDANRDGCTDIADVQATFASLATTSVSVQPQSTTPINAPADHTFTVDSTADTPDAAPGNGTCADSSGRCTLRAALTEADWLSGLDRIQFNLTGTAPVTIQVGSRLPIITSTAGGVIIDGYTQPGSRVNTATVGSNAIPGVNLRGNGASAGEWGLYMTSSGNVVRGLAINNFNFGIFVDGSGAQDNLIVGNWLGYNRDGSNSSKVSKQILINTGANHNVVGTPALADRNVIGNATLGLENYGPGTDYNVMQNNVFCMSPSGTATAACDTGIDYNFGPKFSTIGGSGTNERNVFGLTWLQGIELSHGWNPSQPPRVDNSVTWQINGHQIIGNWVGFRADGSYDPNFRSGQSNPGGGDNGQGINVYDGVYDNVVEGNYVGALYQGITIMAPNAQRNTVRSNIIGMSPQGQNAPLTGWGIRFRWATQFDTVDSNTIANAALGGIGLVEPDVFNIRLTKNVVQSTNGPGIDLYGIAGPDPNDPGDGDSGANTLLNTPVITTATTSSVSGTATIPGATVELFRASRAVGQYGLPSAYLGSAVVASNGTWSMPVSLAVGDIVTSSQIHSDGNTSELSPNVAVTAGGPPPPNNPPTANFTFSCTNLACSFTNTSTDTDGTIASSAWTFGDGGSSGQTSPSHTFGSAGTYSVTLIVTDNGGATGQVSKQVTVQAANASPTANFTFSCTNLACSFTNTSTDADGTIASSAWTFGDGGSSGQTSPSHTYATANTYTVTLTVTDNGGATGQVSKQVTVQAAPNVPPTANFTWSCDHLVCSFGNTSSDSDGTIASSVWNFGDGGSSSQTSPSHTYGAPNTYTVTLTVTDNNGATGQVSKQVTATPPAPISLTARGYKIKGYEYVDLMWNGATTTSVDIYRNGAIIATRSGTRTYTDATNHKGGATFTYKVCEAGSQVCSDSIQVTF